MFSSSLRPTLQQIAVVLTCRLTLDTVPPVAVDKDMIEVNDVAEGQVRVRGKAGSVEPGRSVSITNTRTGQTASVLSNSEGGFETAIAARGGCAIHRNG